MRFVRYRTVVTKVADEEISDTEDLRVILRFLKDKKIPCSLRLTQGPLFEVVRISDVSETVAFNINKDHSILRKRVEYEEIDYLEVHVEDEILSKLNQNVGRFFFLGPAEDV